MIRDEVVYNKMVYQLLDKGIYSYTPYGTSITPNAFTTLGYPLFLAFCYFVVGYHSGNSPIMQIQLLVQIFIQFIGLFVMACYLFHPTLILSFPYIVTETLYGFFNLLFNYLFVHTVNKNNKNRSEVYK
jgi:hypothetical protein